MADASDTTNPDAVVAVLNAYIDDKDAYMRKRLDKSYLSVVSVKGFDQTSKKIETKQFLTSCRVWGIFPCSDSIFVSSYYGLSYSKIAENSTEEREGNFRAFGPVGIEAKIATYKSSSITLNLAPIDIGNYITNELKDEGYSARFEDILAPSVFLAYSFKSKPVSVLFGYQKDIKVDDGFETEGPFLSLAFDLPILTIY